MGIHLDWELEDAPDTLPEPDAGSGGATQPGGSKRRRWWPTVIIVAIVMVATIAGARWRLDDVDRGISDMLESTVYAELLAVRLGDQNKFMQAQGPDEDWRQTQREMFAGIQAYGERIRFPEASEDIRIEGNEARVTVAITVDGEPREFEWTYEYLSERGWRHTCSSAPLWETDSAILPTFEVHYNTLDEDYALRLAGQIQQWWQTTCNALLRCPADHPIDELRVIAGTGENLLIEERGRIVLIVGTTGGNPQNPALEIILRETLLARWVGLAIGEISSADGWAMGELHAWLRHQIDPAAPPSAILDPLVEAFRSPGLPADFANRVRQDMAAQDALYAVMVSRGSDALTGEDLRVHLGGMLRAEIGVQQVLGESVRQMIFDGPHPVGYDSTTWSALLNLDVLDEIQPATLQVVRLITYEDAIWAEVEYDSLRVPSPSPDQPSRAFLPYRFLNGIWQHNSITLNWQMQGELPGELVRITYFQFDEPFIDGLLPYAEDVYGRVADDFGITDDLFTYIFIEPGLYQVRPGEGDSRTIASVYWGCCQPGQAPEDYLRAETARALVWTLMSRRSGQPATGSPIEIAIAAREMEHLGVAHSTARTVPPPPSAYIPPQTLAEIWQTIDFNADPYSAYIRLIAVDALLDVLIEQQGGHQVLGALVEHLDKSADLQRWLGDSLGVDPALIEPAWQERFRGRLAAANIDL